MTRVTEQMGPNFICIGMQKAGTDWLFDQLQFHPDFWMPPVKEFHYFDHPIPRVGRATRFLNLNPRRLAQKQALRRPWDDRDVAFLQEASQLAGLDFARYAALFRFKQGLISGEITPGYSALDEEMIRAINRGLPGTKIVLLVRDPVARAWSQISMAHRNDNFDATLLDTPSRFREFLRTSSLVGDRSFPARIFERWKRCGPELQVQYFLFDKIETDPENARADVLRFLGADPSKRSGDIPPGQNRKSQLTKLPLDAEIKACLIDYLKDELRACAEVFGGAAREWPSRHGL